MDEREREKAPTDAAGEPTGADAAAAAREGATVSRSQNLVHLLPQDWSIIGQVLAPALERVDSESAATQVLVLTRDPASSLAVADAALHTHAGETGLEILPVTSIQRAGRLIAEHAPLAVAATPGDASALIGNSVLKLDQLRTLVIAWLDDMLDDAAAMAALESVMAEVPKTSARVVIAATPSPALDAFVERYMRRARRLEDQPPGEPLPRQIEFITAPESSRPVALRHLLDDLDPATTVIRVRTEGGEADARRTLRRLGYSSRKAVRVAAEGEPSDAEVVVLYELPANREELRALMNESEGRIVAFVEPRQLVTLRRLAGARAARPFALSIQPRRARERQARLLGDLEARLTSERFDRELLALEPLIGAHDGLEVAAALLRMLDDEQARGEARVLELLNGASFAASAEKTDPGVRSSGAAAEPSSPWTRVFISVGERDGASPGDLVGAITGEAGVTREVIGKIDMRESFTVVEIANEVSEQVISRMTGATIRGRQVQARVDRGGSGRDTGERGRFERGGPPRGGPPRGGSDRGPRSFDRGARGPSGFDRGAGGTRSFDRGDRTERPARSFERSDRSDRSARDDRGAGRSFERKDRAPGGFDRDRGDRGGARGSERPSSRPAFDRGERSDRGGRGAPPPRGGTGGSEGRGGGAPRERDRGYGRTQADDRQEWRQRGERLRRSRGGDAGPGGDDRGRRGEEGGTR